MKPITLLKTEDLFLTEDERKSPVWESLRMRLERKLAQLREKNDESLTDVETARLRGHIECLKFILKLGHLPPQKVVADGRPAPRVDYGAQYG